MHGSTDLDELDYLIVSALQHEPRAEWRAIGARLGISPSTAARRWNRLSEAGLAWLMCYPTAMPAGHLLALIELDCAPGRIHETAMAVADDPHLFDLGHVTGGRDLLLIAVFTGQAQLASYIGFRLGALPGVTAIRAHPTTALHTDGSRWRLDRLLGPVPDPAPAHNPGGSPLREGDEAFIRLLGADVRQSVTALAGRTGLSPTTVRRRLARLERDGTIAYRCEVARSRSGWPVGVTFWGSAPARTVGRVAGRLAGLRETRLCASLSGAHNVLLCVWLRSLDDIPAFESSLAAHAPELTVADRSLTLWSLKFAGQILDPGGRRLRSVPLGAWTPGLAGEAEDSFIAALALPRDPASGEAPRPVGPPPQDDTARK
ncbi:Lrp/AsnC family transcriptional regulator [Actinomadura sp. 3N407]|uniref:Lrp/AsnC family transcriptional regulator n=1 Tax=Actinomadura sp. 3N407 TaxID=3457423 RepID=UPI003FCCF055